MNKKLTNRGAFDLAALLQSPEIINIKDTEFAIAVIKNFNTIVEVYNEVEKLNVMTDKFKELIKDDQSKEAIEKLKKVKGNKKLFDERQKSVDAYNKELNKEFDPVLVQVKLKNLNTKLSVADLQVLDPMIKL